MGITRFPHGVSSFGVPIFGSGQDISGTTYFVDNNYGNDSNDGFSWEQPLKTLAAATTLNNADIARGSDRWARRNTIYYAADTETATLVAFPNKCDVIGVGSYDANTMPGITGHHAPVNASNYGTRFFNVWFKATAVASPVVTLASTSSGIQFIGCMFDGVAGTVTSGILATAAPNLRVINCDFMGAFATSCVSFGTGAMLRPEIRECRMNGAAAAGIIVASGTTAAYGGYITDNYIQAVGLCIDENSDKFYIVNNTCLSDVASTTTATLAEVIDSNVALSAGNTISCGDVKNTPYPVVDSTGSV